MAAAAVRLAERIFERIADQKRPVHRRRRDDRAVCHAFRGAAAETGGHRQPDG
jgi:hypothetical protein